MRIGLYLALVQLLFTATWTIYVAFLPQLAAAAGIAKQWVIWILMLDQAIFIVMDLALGISADRVATAMRRVSTPMIIVTAVSALAFVLVMVLSGMIFHEAITPLKMAGAALVVLGIIVGSQG